MGYAVAWTSLLGQTNTHFCNRRSFALKDTCRLIYGREGIALKDIDLMTKGDHLHECVAHSTRYRFDYMTHDCLCV